MKLIAVSSGIVGGALGFFELPTRLGYFVVIRCMVRKSLLS